MSFVIAFKRIIGAHAGPRRYRRSRGVSRYAVRCFVCIRILVGRQLLDFGLPDAPRARHVDCPNVPLTVAFAVNSGLAT
ncbi:hypothetical protein BDI4_210041 [Burkholderia diffusa]|nr:hypothetical protein BDI4_210041 [Burkholderia diffusa]